MEADRNGEGEPSLDAGIEEAEDGMNLVVVEEQAFAGAQLSSSTLGERGALSLDCDIDRDARHLSQVASASSASTFRFTNQNSQRSRVLPIKRSGNREHFWVADQLPRGERGGGVVRRCASETSSGKLRSIATDRLCDPAARAQQTSCVWFQSVGRIWCREQDLNLHAFRHTVLSRARLPIPPSRLDPWMAKL
jgi:hypothetical protein